MSKSKKRGRILVYLCMLFAICLAAFAIYYFMNINHNTSTDYRYPWQFDKTLEQYTKFQNLVNEEKSFAIPGLARTNLSGEAGITKKGISVYYEEAESVTSKTMIPQGICVAGDYIVLSAYDGKQLQKSVLYVLSRETRQYLTTIVLEDQNHVGGLAFDGAYIWIAKSSDNALSCIAYDTICQAVKLERDSVVVPYHNTCEISCRASFLSYYDGLLWVGVFEKEQGGVGMMRGFEYVESENLKGLYQKEELFLPELANGACILEQNGQVCLIVNTSHGRKNSSTVRTYELNFHGDDYEHAVCELKTTYMFPPMLEEVEIADGEMLFVFESAATKYTRNYTFRCSYPVDRVCSVNVEDMFVWLNRDNQSQAVVQDSKMELDTKLELDTRLGYHVSSALDARSIPTYVKVSGDRDIQMLYNPYSARMAFNIMSDSDYVYQGSQVGTKSWNDTLAKCGYSGLQTFRHESIMLTKRVSSTVDVMTGILRVPQYNGQEKYNVILAIKGLDLTELKDSLPTEGYKYQNGVIQGFYANAISLYARIQDLQYDIPMVEAYEEDNETRYQIRYQKVSLASMLEAMQQEDSPYTVTVIGEGIGGGIVNALVGKVMPEHGIFEGNVNAYAFGALPVFKKNPGAVTNVFNIVNESDLVTKLEDNEQIGTVIRFRADETFAKRYYGEGYVPEFIDAAHSSVVYKAILETMEADIGSYVAYNTETTLSLLRAVTITKNCFADFSGLMTSSTLVVEPEAGLRVRQNLRSKNIRIQGDLVVRGNLHAKYVVIEDGKVYVDGDCSIANSENGTEGKLVITGDDGRLEVTGAWNVPWFRYTKETEDKIIRYGE